MMDGIQSAESGFDDGQRVWNQHVAMIEDVADRFVQESPTGDLSFEQMNAHEVVLEVPEEENWLSFMICFYCTVYTPRLRWVSDEDSQTSTWSRFADGL